MIQCFASAPPLHASHHHSLHFLPSKITATLPSSSSSPFLSTTTTSRRAVLSFPIITTTLSALTLPFSSPTSSNAASAATVELSKLPNSGGVKALDLRTGSGPVPVNGDQVAIHYYGRLAAKQGWRFDSTYDHKDGSGEPIPFVFTLGSGKVAKSFCVPKYHNMIVGILAIVVITGIEAAVRSMKVGGICRVVIPPSQGYQNTSQEPLPPNFFDRQRLFTTIFNPTRLANGEGSTLGTLIFDIELVSLRH
ncbi:hypothetical protein Pint_11597 [Pistacia integerrima]|uniref:Uncharacterized protein n=1 Tax=Pistacia integerrima TaxID=434235 RepID=A0ACC0XH32_9ROSI|nr:hypothetical protein Pint_11597 [Pistacia integerrima]